MKKAMALLLAIMLVMGLNTVAFAASTTKEISVHDTDLYTFNTSNKEMETYTESELVPGKTYYVWLENKDAAYAKDTAGNATPFIKSSGALANYRCSYTKSKFVQSVGMVVKDLARAPSGSGGKGKYAFVAIALKEDYISTSEDIEVTVKLAGASNSASFTNNDSRNYDFEFFYTMAYGITEVNGSYTTIDEKNPVVDFSGLDEKDPIELYFGDTTFTVKARNQKELFLKYSDDPTDTKYDLDEKYPDADLDYHLFAGTKKTFTSEGELKIPARMVDDEKAPNLYTITADGKVAQASGAKYDKTEEAFIVKTKTLNNYVVSDTKLKATGATSEEESSSDDEEDASSSTPTPPPSTNINPGDNNDNPATGTSDVAGLAVGLTAVSLVAIAAASIRKRK